MYFLHLAREDSESSITLEEWKRAIAAEEDMEFSNTTEYTSLTGELVVKSGGFYGIWTLEGKKVYFWLEEGIVNAVYDTKTLAKIHSLSRQLNGIVFGDMGEEL